MKNITHSATLLDVCSINHLFTNLSGDISMPKYFSIQRVLHIACLPALLIGCAADQTLPVTEPTPILSGEQMLRESEGMAKLGSRWEQGVQMVERGQNLVREGKSKIDEGNRMVEEGQKVIRESEEGYKNIKK